MTKAASELKVTPSALSHRLKFVEQQIGLRLFNRTTRSIALTVAGEQFLKRLQPAFDEIDLAMEYLNFYKEKPSGSIRINAGKPAIQLTLLALINEFLKLYPEIDIEIISDHAPIDIVSQGFDAGVRFGEVLEKDMIAIPLGKPIRSVIVGTPDFFEKHPKPQDPYQLKNLPCINLRFSNGKIYKWEFKKQNHIIEIEVQGKLILDDVGLIATAALQGHSLAYVFEGLVQDQINQGALVTVLTDWYPHYSSLYLYYPSRQQLPYAMKVFIEFIRQNNSL